MRTYVRFKLQDPTGGIETQTEPRKIKTPKRASEN